MLRINLCSVNFAGPTAFLLLRAKTTIFLSSCQCDGDDNRKEETGEQQP